MHDLDRSIPGEARDVLLLGTWNTAYSCHLTSRM